MLSLAPDREAILHRRPSWESSTGDRITKEEEDIQASERELVALPASRPPTCDFWHCLESTWCWPRNWPVNLGPIVHYATARVITGRAGLFPAASKRSRRLPAGAGLSRKPPAPPSLAHGRRDSLSVQQPFPSRQPTVAQPWEGSPRRLRPSGGSTVGDHVPDAAGATAFRHPACQGPTALLEKLIEFHNEHEINLTTTRTNLRHAAAQLPGASRRVSGKSGGEAGRDPWQAGTRPEAVGGDSPRGPETVGRR